MNFQRFVMLYGRVLASVGLALTIAALIVDPRWTHQWIEILVMLAACVGLRGQAVRLSHKEITRIEPQAVSLMPAGLESVLSKQELADLVEYLQSLK